jgi:hypothetical protein
VSELEAQRMADKKREPQLLQSLLTAVSQESGLFDLK